MINETYGSGTECRGRESNSNGGSTAAVPSVTGQPTFAYISDPEHPVRGYMQLEAYGQLQYTLATLDWQNPPSPRPNLVAPIEGFSLPRQPYHCQVRRPRCRDLLSSWMDASSTSVPSG